MLLAHDARTYVTDGPDLMGATIWSGLVAGGGGSEAGPGQPGEEPSVPTSDAVASPDHGLPISHQADADFETLFARDVLLTQTTLNYGQTILSTEWELGLSLASMGFDYEPVPFDFRGVATVVQEARVAAQLELRQRLGDRLTLLATGGLYDGFTDFRSAWIDEHFRQQYGDLPGYEEAAPRGVNIQGGVRWEYLPASGFLQAEAAYLQDQIAPGYEIDFDGFHRGRPILYTTVWRCYFTDYEPFSLGTAFFANLYQDRSWGLVQAAYHLQF